MKPSSTLRTRIESLPDGSLIRQAELGVPAGGQLAAAKLLSRMVQNGELERIERGLYYKPKKTPFGRSRPGAREVLAKLLEKNGGYITGTAAYNRLGLTTQNPGVIVIAGRTYRSPRSVAGVTIRCRRTKVTPTPQNVELLEILDALRAAKRIPDAAVDDVVRGVIAAIGALTPAQRTQLVECALAYNPSVRALVGAIMRARWPKVPVDALASSLNPLTVYKIGITSAVLPNAKAWGIR